MRKTMKIKKFLLAITVLMAGCLAAVAGEKIYHDGAILPEAAKAMLTKNFKAGVSLVKVDSDFGRVSEYEVILTDGTEVSFDRSGNWKEVDTSIKKQVPSNLMPKAIVDYVKKNHNGTRIVGVENKGSRGFEINLSNDIDLIFNADGKFLRYDD